MNRFILFSRPIFIIHDSDNNASGEKSKNIDSISSINKNNSTYLCDREDKNDNFNVDDDKKMQSIHYSLIDVNQSPTSVACEESKNKKIKYSADTDECAKSVENKSPMMTEVRAGDNNIKINADNIDKNKTFSSSSTLATKTKTSAVSLDEHNESK
jgi:hypothetical protein